MNIKDVEGIYGDYKVKVTEDNALMVFPRTKEIREELNQLIEDNGLAAAELDVIDALVSRDITYVAPEEIGALTEANILAYGSIELDEDGDFLSSDFMWTDIAYYQVRSFVDDMLELGYCYFDLVR